jgi:hypothetical protein
MLSQSQKHCLHQLNDQLPVYLQRLASPSQMGRFLPCETGATELGRQIALGYGCFALKAYYMLGLWQGLDAQKKTEWIRFIKSYQVKGPYGGDARATGAFIDPPLMEFHKPRHTFPQRVAQYFKPSSKLTTQQEVISAETKQAIATLLEVGESLDAPYAGFPRSPEGVQEHIGQLDWTKPWGAGGQASALVVFLKTQATQLMSEQDVRLLVDVCKNAFISLADAQSGYYFAGNTSPSYDEAVNGAMKVLTALDWLETSVHYPEQLIDSCLTRLPSPEGCHLVDAVYVLYRCLQFTSHRKQEIQAYCIQVLEMVQKHHNADGGLSYSIGRSQTSYYGAPISTGLPESDIHGTILLTWAIAMILDVLEDNFLDWKVIRP